VALIGAEYAWLRGRLAARAIAQANERVAGRIDDARAHLAARHWDEAIRDLEDAQEIGGATNRDEVSAVLEQARRGQADALLEAANLAVARRDVGNALDLLRAYVAHPQATELAHARLLCADIERATSSEAAAAVLASLSEDALTVFARQGRLTQDDGLRSDAAHEIFKDTLRRQLARELHRRAAKRDAERMAAHQRAIERAQRMLLLRNTPTFRALAAFVAQTLAAHHARQELAQRKETELQQLFQQLDVTDPEEQATIRAGLVERADDKRLARSVDRKRADIKRAYRASPEYQAADRELFDRLADQELDNLLKVLNRSENATSS